MKLFKIDETSDKPLIQEYIDMYLDLINLHYEEAALQGIYDAECDRKTKEDAIDKLTNPDIQIELLCDHAEVIGYVRYQADHTETEQMIVDEIKEEMDGYSDDSLFNITSFGTDMTFRELITMYEEGDLEKPEMQRNYVWNKNEASRFIDSVLLGLPVPSIFLAKTKMRKLCGWLSKNNDCI